ncbi:MAG: UDP-N-acetylmuramoyl-tripeptide--D-alanyl-D-alanine ligase [Microthrixaceae bacterium]
MRFTWDELIEATGGTGHGVARSEGGRLGAGPAVEGASIDSRTIVAGRLFVAVVAERDGHDFVGAAVAGGASAALVEHRVDEPVAQVVVSDTVRALGRLGRAARARTVGPVVGITGSVGKTSTKDLLAAVCAMAGPTTASERSLNNEMGVPLTLLNASPDARRTVVEMGARGAGHIAALCDIARPTVGVVTAVAPSHTELFGSIDDVARAKRELPEALPETGAAVLNAEDPRVMAMAAHTAAEVVTFGAGGVVVAEGVYLDDELRPRFTLRSPWGSVEVRLGVRGAHNVTNALAAAAAAMVTGVPPDHVGAGLGAAELSPSRMALHRLDGGGLVIDDAYNANPASMRAALDALAALPVRRRIAVLGVMAELGEDMVAEHAAVATYARERGIELVAVGTEFYGVTPIADPDALTAPTPGEAILVKASRVAGLDRLARRWCGEGSRAR